MGITISTDSTNVSATHPLPTNLPESVEAGFAALTCESDDGTGLLSGERSMIELEGSEDYRLRVGVDTPLWTLPCSGTVFDRSSLIDAATTATVTQAIGAIILNGGASVAANAVARVTSCASWAARQGAGIQLRQRLQTTQLPVANNVVEWGFVQCTGTTAPTDGIFWRYNAVAELECVVVFNSTATAVTVDMDKNPNCTQPNVNHEYAIDWYNDKAVFWLDGQRVAIIECPDGQPNLVSCEGLPVTFRTYNGATGPSVAQVVRVGRSEVLLQDANNTRPWKETQALAGLASYQWPPNGATVGPLVTHANAAAPTAYALTNTAAPNAAHAVLNGDFLATLSGLTAQTDYILNVWQNPPVGAVLGGRLFMITSLHFDAELAGAANAATIQSYELLAGIGATAVTLVTVADATNGVKCARRVPLQRISFPASAGIGTAFNFDVRFDTPLILNAGEYFHLILKPIFYTSVASQQLRYALRVEGCWV